MPSLKFSLLSTLLLTITTAHAAVVDRINVSGNERIEAATVQNYLPQVIGEDVTPEAISELVKRLYRTGLFENVQMQVDGGTLNIMLEENPLVNQIAFEGNDKIVDERLQDVISLSSRAIYTPARVQQDVQSLLQAYRARGRFLTEVRPQIIERDQNRVDVIYTIDEGEKTSIEDIRFVGNEKFTDRELKRVVATKESAFWRFLTTADSYDPNRIEVDQELLRRHYIKNGFADFQVNSAIAELNNDKTKFFITYTVNEGEVYDFGTTGVMIAETAEGVNADDLQDVITIEAGEIYNALRVENTVDNMIDDLGTKGFAFLDVQPEFDKNEAERTIDVTFNVTPGPRVYVNRINIEGNDRTRDYVLRREMKIIEGDAFSSTKLKRSKDRLTFLGFFEDVAITPTETEYPDRMDLNVTVKEQSTGEFNVGAGFSTYEGLLATADVKERNFLGKGQTLGIGFALSGIKQNFNINFTEPYFLDRRLSAGFDLYNEETNLQDESSYDLGTAGGALRFGLPIDEFSSNTIRFGYKSTDISDVGANASQFVQREEGKRDSLFISNTFTRDTRDSFLVPTRGYRTSFSGEYSGFGADVEYFRALANGSWHKSLGNDFVLSLGARAGAIWDLADDLPIYEHFTAGGTTLRGFDSAGIGPRDSITGDALGGMYMVGNNAELSFPLPGVRELGVSGLIFADGGMVTEFEGDTGGIDDSQEYRISAGAGIFWQSPVGPLRLEFGFPVVKSEEDETRVFSFSIGSRF